MSTNTNVLPFARPVAPTSRFPQPTPLYWSAGDGFLGGGLEGLLARLRHEFEVSSGAARLIRKLPLESDHRPLVMVESRTVLQLETLTDIDTIHRNTSFTLANPLSALTWASFSFNRGIARGEIGVAMVPIDDHYLAFVNNGQRSRPRLICQPHQASRRYRPTDRWVCAA